MAWSLCPGSCLQSVFPHPLLPCRRDSIRVSRVDVDGKRARLTLWDLRLDLKRFGGGKRRGGLENCEEQGPCCLSPLAPSVSSLALALQGDCAEMCPELVNSCEAHGAGP